MAKIDWIHLCDSTEIGSADKCSLIGIFDAVFTTAFPTRSKMVMVAKLSGAANEVVRVHTLVRDEKGGLPLLNGEGEVELPAFGKMFLRVDLEMIIPQPGNYVVLVRSGSRVLASASFRAILVPDAKPTAH